MFYKVIHNGVTVDVAQSPLDCVKYDTTSKRVLACGEAENPCGICSARVGVYFHVTGWAAFPATVQADNVTLTECSQTEYIIEKSRLDKGNKSVEEVAAEAEQQRAVLDYNIMMGNLEDPEEANVDE